MELFKTIKELQQALTADKNKGFSIGFVPTMGALHRGHLSLVEKGCKGRDLNQIFKSIVKL